MVETRYIPAALEHTRQDVPRAASLLGIKPSTTYRKQQPWGAEEALDRAWRGGVPPAA